MRRRAGLVSGFAALCALAVAAAAAVLAAPARAGAAAGPERISSYDVDITIQRDASILVNEQIVYDFGASQRHGIFRDIPVRPGTTAATTGSKASTSSRSAHRMRHTNTKSPATAHRYRSRSGTPVS